MAQHEPVRQTRSIVIDLAPGETKTWQLPAMSTASDQRIVIKTVLYTAPTLHGRFDDLPELTETTLARRPPGGPVIEGGETRDLTHELLRSGVVVAVTDTDLNKPGQLNHVTGPTAGDVWALRVSRKPEGAPRRYQLTIEYPSELIEVERRISLGFFDRGFDQNWTQNLLVEDLAIGAEGIVPGHDGNPHKLIPNDLSYRWRKDFADLYGKPTDVQYVTLLDTELIRFPKITGITLLFRSDGGVLPGGRGEVPYFELVIKGHYAGSRNLTFHPAVQFIVDAHTTPIDVVTGVDNKWFELPSDPGDPSSISFTVRFYVRESSGAVTYHADVSSPLLDALPGTVKYPNLGWQDLIIPLGFTDWREINVKDTVKKRIEDSLNTFPNQLKFDQHIRPFLVGRSEHPDLRLSEEQSVLALRHDVLGVSYDRPKHEMVITYADHRRPPLRQPPDGVDSFPMIEVAPVPTAVPDGHPGRPIPQGPLATAVPTGLSERLSHLGNLRDVPTIDFERYPPLFDTHGEQSRPAPPNPPLLPDTSPGALAKIDHIVVLMQENRSFDQVLGYLSRDGVLTRDGRVLQDHVDGLLPGDNARDKIEYPAESGTFYPSKVTHTTSWPERVEGPCHGHACVVRQIDHEMKGFLSDYARDETGRANLQLIMNYYTDAELPAFGALTREFAICDHWFCSFLGGTLPNRFVSLTGGLSRDKDGNLELENPDLGDSRFAPIETDTFFDHLTRQGVPWKLFEHNYSTLRMFRNFTFDETKIASFTNADTGFEAAALSGTLPAVSFIEPNYIEEPGDDNDDHAPADMFNGQRLVARIVNALLEGRSTPGGPTDLFERTLLIITYDEHGGFYDHVQPPKEVETTAPDGTVTRTPIPPLADDLVLGLRVPAFVVSAFIPPMTDGKVNVAKTLFDHTTIPATILRRFCSPQPPYMGARTAAAADVGHLLTLETPRPRSEFADLAQRMKQILAQPARSASTRTKPAPLRREVSPIGKRDNFGGMLAYLSSVTGRGAR